MTNLKHGAIITLSDIISSLINQHAQFSNLNFIHTHTLTAMVCTVWFEHFLGKGKKQARLKIKHVKNIEVHISYLTHIIQSFIR